MIQSLVFSSLAVVVGFLPHCAAIDPAAQQIDFKLCQTGTFWGHAFIEIVDGDAAKKFAAA